jgi:hypothetical protein
VFTGGYQTRSRAVLKPPTPGGEPCPTALWETRPCFTGPCLTFGWVVDDDGHISCQRSDGVIVEGKCFLLLTLAFCRILVVHFVIIIQSHFYQCCQSYNSFLHHALFIKRLQCNMEPISKPVSQKQYFTEGLKRLLPIFSTFLTQYG